MPDKWSDYLISAVRYNATGSHIDEVRVHVDNGDTVGSGTSKTRDTVISQLSAGTTFATIYKNSDGKWNLGASVEIVTIEGTKYIKTVPDNTKKDNLGDLPRF